MAELTKITFPDGAPGLVDLNDPNPEVQKLIAGWRAREAAKAEAEAKARAEAEGTKTKAHADEKKPTPGHDKK